MSIHTHLCCRSLRAVLRSHVYVWGCVIGLDATSNQLVLQYANPIEDDIRGLLQPVTDLTITPIAQVIPHLVGVVGRLMKYRDPDTGSQLTTKQWQSVQTRLGVSGFVSMVRTAFSGPDEEWQRVAVFAVDAGNWIGADQQVTLEQVKAVVIGVMRRVIMRSFSTPGEIDVIASAAIQWLQDVVLPVVQLKLNPSATLDSLIVYIWCSDGLWDCPNAAAENMNTNVARATALAQSSDSHYHVE